jgi:hypothetical protein
MGSYSSPKLGELTTVSSTFCSSCAPKSAFENFSGYVLPAGPAHPVGLSTVRSQGQRGRRQRPPPLGAGTGQIR